MNVVEPIKIVDGPQMIYSSLPESEDPWDGSHAYVEGDTCRLFETNRVYKCATANTGKRPDLYLVGVAVTGYWVEMYATMRFKPFDSKVTDQAISVNGTIQYTLNPGIFDSITFLNMDATSVHIIRYAPSEFGPVFDAEFDLIVTSNITDAYSYCFSPIIKKTDLAVTDMPPYFGGTVLITITNSDGTAKVGEIIFGVQKYIGRSDYNPEASINNYSKKDVDDYGNFTVVKRAFSRRLRVNLGIDNTIVDEVHRLLSQYKDTPMLWLTTNDQNLNMLITYGFCKSFAVVVPYPDESNCSLEIEGLT